MRPSPQKNMSKTKTTSSGGSTGARTLPRRPGDNTSFSSSLNERNGDDSDTSDYNYESQYMNNTQNNTNQNLNQQSDDDRSVNNVNNDQDYYQDENDDNESSFSYGQQQAAGSSKFNRNHNRSGNSRSAADIEEQNMAAAALAAQQNEAMKEFEMHKKRLQIYVFVCRCISYPFIAKQPTDMVRRQLKITKQQMQTLKDNFELFLQNKMSSVEADEAFTNAVRSYYEVFLKSDRIAKMVNSGGCSSSDFRDVFKNNIEKRVRSLPEIDGLSKETVLTSWMAKFDSIFRYNEENTSTNVIASRRHSRNINLLNNQMSSECILTKEQLYEMFQNILGIKKFEHQLLFNAAQVWNIHFNYKCKLP